MSESDGSDTFLCNVGFQIQCLSLNGSANRVIAAGKTEYKVYAIDDRSFIDKSYYQLNSRTVCIMDVCWSGLNETMAVSSGTNGELHKLIIGESDLTLDYSFKFHERTINKINFHPTEENLLISGGQDGIIKLIDFRCRTDNSPVASFAHDITDKVSDVQFNPSSSMIYQFASGSFNGHTYIWDTRNPSKYERKITAHVNQMHLDWHPEDKYCLATASRDKKIHIWDLSGSERSSIKNLTNLEGVVSIKWRPQRPTQITACSSSGFDSHLYVWDTDRPYVPYASFDSLTNKVQNFAWRSSKVLVASSKSNLINTSIDKAIRPADHSTLVTVEIDKHGSVAFAVSVEDPKTAAPPAPTAASGSKRPDFKSLLSHTDSDKFHITRSILKVADEIPDTKTDWFYYASTNYQFKNKSFEELCEHNAQIALTYNKFSIYKDWMILKTIYKETPSEILKEAVNSHPTSNNNSANLTSANIIFSNVESNFEPRMNTNENQIQFPTSISTATTASMTSPTNSSNSSTSKSSSSNSILSDDELAIDSNGNSLIIFNNNMNAPSTNNRDGMFQFQLYHQQASEAPSNSGHLMPGGLAPTYKTTTSASSNNASAGGLNANNYFSLEAGAEMDEMGKNIGYRSEVNNYEEDTNSYLPTDIIEYQEEPIDDINNFVNNLFSSTSHDKPAFTIHDNELMSYKTLSGVEYMPDSRNAAVQTILMPQPQSYQSSQQTLVPGAVIHESSSSSKNPSLLKNLAKSSMDPMQSAGNTNENATSSSNSKFLDISNLLHITESTISTKLPIMADSKFEMDKFFQNLLLNYVNDSDLPTAIFMYLVAVINEKFDRNDIEPIFSDEWFSQYIELLAKFELWNLRIEIIKEYRSDFIKNLTQQSIVYNLMCAACKKNLKPGMFICPSCQKKVLLCSYCHLPVKRLYAWCHNCCHGGHLDHMMKWFKKHNRCPTGCPCKCVFSLSAI